MKHEVLQKKGFEIWGKNKLTTREVKEYTQPLRENFASNNEKFTLFKRRIRRKMPKIFLNFWGNNHRGAATNLIKRS